jgi:hypothetical protein
MGMYDTIRFFDLPALTCAAGHEIGELQTKDLESAMVRYLVHEGRLYRERGNSEGTETAQLETGGPLVVMSRRLADPVSLTSEVVAYANCNECRPVLYILDAGGRGLWGDYVRERYPWCEWRLVFSAGRLERSDAERVETRDAVRRDLLGQGLDVLDDDDRLARLHFRRLEKEKE